MSDCIVEQIAQQIVTRLELQTTANGYSSPLVAVYRPTRDGEFLESDGTKVATISDQSAFLDQESDKTDSASSAMGQTAKRGRIAKFAIYLFSIPSDRDVSQPVDAAVNDLVASSIKAVTTPEDSLDWGRMNGLSINSWIGDVTLYKPQEGEYAGAILELYVQYRTPENDPYTAA